MSARTNLAVLVSAALGAVVLAGCGGSSSNTFTVKIDYSGQIAYLVVGVSAHQGAIEHALTKKLNTGGLSAFVTSNQPAGSLDCSRQGKIGEHHTPAPALRPYLGQNISVKVYGSGALADAVCSGLLSDVGGS